MPLLLSFFFGFAPMFLFASIVYWLDRYEKEPVWLLAGVFTWGVVVASGGAFLINTLLGMGVYLFTGSEAATNLSTGVLFAPVVEECLKGLAVMLVFLAFRREFDSILDGIVYAAVVALGFAATENTYYIYTYGYLEDGMQGLLWLAFVRVILVGWQHPFYTAFTGIGLAVSRSSRAAAVKAIAPVAGLSLAVAAHSFHNLLANTLSGLGGILFGTALDWIGWFLMVLIIVWAIGRDRRSIEEHLREEVELGVLTPAQYRAASNTWAQSAARLGSLFTGRYGDTNRFYQTCAELAHKKQQVQDVGDEGGNGQVIERLRGELARLGERVT